VYFDVFGEVGIIFRFDNESNYYAVSLFRNQKSAICLEKMVAG
jgi:hypothetical protein